MTQHHHGPATAPAAAPTPQSKRTPATRNARLQTRSGAAIIAECASVLGIVVSSTSMHTQCSAMGPQERQATQQGVLIQHMQNGAPQPWTLWLAALLRILRAGHWVSACSLALGGKS